MGDHTAESLRARHRATVGPDIGEAIARVDVILEDAITALETAERERDAALAAYEDERNRSTTIAQAERERDEARDALAACEASKADEERANAGLVAEVARLRAEYRRLEDDYKAACADRERGIAVGRATAADPLPECPEWTWGWS